MFQVLCSVLETKGRINLNCLLPFLYSLAWTLRLLPTSLIFRNLSSFYLFFFFFLVRGTILPCNIFGTTYLFHKLDLFNSENKTFKMPACGYANTHGYITKLEYVFTVISHKWKVFHHSAFRVLFHILLVCSPPDPNHPVTYILFIFYGPNAIYCHL